ncbi:MAG: hypothetical protein ABWZ66_10375 [Pyrinomonadaceae bacterium]
MNKRNNFTTAGKIAVPAKSARLLAIAAVSTFVFIVLSSVFPAKVSADGVYFLLSPATPLQQNWSNTSLIATNNDWSGVSSITGFAAVAGGFGFGIDPQTITTDFYSTNPYVFANITNPNSTTTGSGGTGFAEFEIANPVVGIRPAVSRYAPNLDIRLDTTGCPAANDIRVGYSLRDIDAGGNNAVAQFALQYRIGGAAGDYTNIPAGYVADATTGPNQATLVTNVNAALPADAKNQPEVHVRIITTDAVGWDEWVGIDDINVSCAAPTAALAAIAGRATTTGGKPIGRVYIKLVMPSGEIRQAQTNPFGYYKFYDVPTGESYILSAHSKQFTFAHSPRVISVFEDIADADFTGGNFGN